MCSTPILCGSVAQDDCIPPHIDSHDFDRPFCTISLLSEEEIMFGANLRPKGADYPGVFVNDQCRIGLPLGVNPF